MNADYMTYRGLALVELIIAVIILGVLAAMAIPQLSTAATHDAEEQLHAELVRFRTAIDLYYHDHGVYPGQRPAGAPGAEAGTAAAVILQLSQYTDADGRASPRRSADFRFGPYLRDGIPRCPVLPPSRGAGMCLICGTATPRYREAAGGWVYNFETGYVAANSPDTDASGMRYDVY